MFFKETPVSEGNRIGRLLRIGPALPEIVAGSQQSAPITLRRSPYAVLSSAAVISHRVNIVSVEIRTTDLPTAALRIGAKDECSFRGSHQQKKVSLPDMSVLHAVQDRSSGWTYDQGWDLAETIAPRLNGFQSRLNFTRALITLRGFLGQAALDNGPQARRHGRPKRVRDFAHDRRADLKASASLKGKASGSRFIEHNSKRP